MGSADSPRIRRYKADTIRKLEADKDGTFLMYIPECVQIYQYAIYDILNIGQLEPGGGGALGNRRL